jgi:hypothetical protein
MGARSRVNRLGCACACIVVLVGCSPRGGGAATNASTAAVNVAALTAAPPQSPAANASQSDLFPIDNAADNATNTVDPVEAGLLAAKNTDCVDQLIKAQPFGESRSQIIDNVTKACLPIAKWEAQASPKPPASVDASERTLVSGRVHDLIDDPSPPPSNSSPPSSSPPRSSPPSSSPPDG